MGFLLVHGISIGVSLRLRRERDPERVRALVELSVASVGGIHVFMFVILITGVALGFMGDWWGQLWIWAGLFVLFGMWIVMYALGTRYYDDVRRAVGVEPFYGAKTNPAAATVDREKLDVLLSSSRPYALTAVGVGALAVLFWLMMFKPF